MEKLARKHGGQILFYGAAILLLALEISSQSYWTDEAIRLYSLAFEGLAETLQYGLEDKQLLFVLTAWVWRHLFGAGEWAMRALNIPFALVMLWYLRRILVRARRPAGYAFLLLLQPIFAYYMNEASPYLMLGAFGAAFFYYSIYAPEPDGLPNLFRLNLAFLLGVATHFIFVFIYPVYLVALWWRLRKKRAGRKELLHGGGMLLCFSPAYLALAILVLQNLSSGSERGWEMPGLKNLAAIVYLFLGLGGLCLSRNELRAMDWAALDGFAIAQSALLLGAMALIALVLWRKKRLVKIFRKYRLILIGSGAYFVCFWVMSMAWKFQIWERHLFPLVIPFVLLEAEALCALRLEKGGKALQVLAILLVFMQAFSCFNLRFVPSYGKDDYKGVARLLHQAEEEGDFTLFTSGYHLAYRFYGISPQDSSGIQPQPGDLCSTVINGWSVEELEQALDTVDGPAIVVLNEKELPRDTYLWDGPEDCQVLDVYNSFRILWIGQPGIPLPW